MKFSVIKKAFFALILALALTLFSPLSFAIAQEKLDENSVRFYDVHTIDAGEKITLCASNHVYVMDETLNKDSIVTFEINGAKKAFSSLDSLVVLVDDALYCDGVEIARDVVDFYAFLGTVYYCSNNGIFAYDQLEGVTSQLSDENDAFAITENAGNVYYATKHNGYCDVFVLENGISSLLYQRTRAFHKLVFDDKLYGVSQNALYDFVSTSVVDAESESFTIKNSVTYILKSNNVYTQDGFALGSGKEIFYPTDASSFNDVLAISNGFGINLYTLTNGEYEKTKTIDAITEICAVCPKTTAIYYTNENVLYKWTEEKTEQYEYPKKIEDVTVDEQGNVYVSAQAIYKNGELLYENANCIIALNSANNDVVCYDCEAFYLNGEYAFEKQGIISFDIDDDGNIFALNSNGIVEQLDNDGNTVNTYQFEVEQAVSISILRSLSCAGKIAIVDKYAHNVIFSDEAIATVYETLTSTPDTYPNDFMRKLTANTSVYADMLRSSTLDVLNENTTVFCLVYDIETNANFSYVAYNTQDGLKTGYVLKSTLSDAIYGDTPLYDTATTFYDSVHVLALPYNLEQTPNSKLLTIENKGESVALISKINVFGFDWYNVRYNGIEGFISASSLQLDQYVPTIRPNVNATITTTCATYEKQGDEFVETNVFISQNSRVEIVGVFDTNTDYTLINYYNESAGGVRTCYVATSALKYDYTTPEQQIALILIVVLSVTTIIALVIGIGLYKSKHNN